MTSEGELKKRIIAAYDNLDKGSSYWDNLAEINNTFDEAKKDIGLDPSIYTREQLQKRLDNDKTMTQLEETYCKLVVKLLYWFGDSDDSS